MPSVTALKAALASVAQKGTRAAAQGRTGHDVLATQEVKSAYQRGEITKAQRDVLQRAVADGGTKVADLQPTLDDFEEIYNKADLNHDFKVDKNERDQAQANLTRWQFLAAIPEINLTPALRREKAELKAKLVTYTHVGSNGQPKQHVAYSVGALLDKLNALVKETVE